MPGQTADPTADLRKERPEQRPGLRPEQLPQPSAHGGPLVGSVVANPGPHPPHDRL